MPQLDPDFKPRVLKKLKHLKKWARRQSISCYQVYDNDLESVPCRIEWLETKVVCWIYKWELGTEALESLRDQLATVLADVFECESDNVIIKYRQKQQGLSSQYSKLGHQQQTMMVRENGLKFELNCFDYLDTGLFLDHRTTRQICKEKAANKRVLNLFAYTGSFSVYARDGGAKSITTVDMNKHYLEWAKRNMAHNFDSRASDRFIEDNVLKFVKNEAKLNRYDLIICDPPTFSNSKKMKSAFSVDDHYLELITDCLKLLSDGGELIFSTNSKKFKWQSEGLLASINAKEISAQTIPEDFKQSKPHRAWLIVK